MSMGEDVKQAIVGTVQGAGDVGAATEAVDAVATALSESVEGAGDVVKRALGR